jgi:hypothetical protein
MSDVLDAMQFFKVRNFLLVLMVLVLAILAGTLVPVYLRQRTPQKAFDSYNRFLLRKEYTRAYAMLIRETRAAGSEESFELVQQSYTAQHGALRGYQQGATNTHLQDPGLIAIRETLIYEKGSVPFVMLLRKDGLLWEVWGMIEE